MNRDEIESSIKTQLGSSFKIDAISPVAGGDINQCFQVSCGKQKFFIKLNLPQHHPLFIAEFLSLEKIGQSNTLLTPRPICHGQSRTHSYLLMEFLELHPCKDRQTNLGQSLAEMHLHQNKLFGWPTDNFIGTTPQKNEERKNWKDFWIENRLQPQATLAIQNGCNKATRDALDRVIEHCQHTLKNHTPPASLLHGDLWAGNAACLANGSAVIYDPAAYYGDRETDLAMTELFGGFSKAFYNAYQSVWPLDQTYEQRKPLYQLYHIVNHYNLFGGSYEEQIRQLCTTVLRA